ncbi:MAG: division/cell wall cluster transcriptional repressor MraZ [Chloroflexi bacterium]|nr:division/cell wall cluster transcriptional repressor MraZ [Chloroflexota bacterium]
MFLGRYEHSIDAKGRIAVPAKFREGLRGGLVVTRGIDTCLTIYPLAEWQPLAEKVNSLSITDPDARNLRRMFFASAVDSELDAQGRLILPPHLRSFAQLESDVIVVGMNTYIEIWSNGKWAEVETFVDNQGASIAERLTDLI